MPSPELLRRPWRRIRRWLRVPVGLRIINFLCQRLFRLNADTSVSVHFTSKVVQGKRLVLGEDVALSLAVSGGCYLQAGNGIEIGDHTIFAPGVKIVSANHGTGPDRRWQPGPPVKVGANCWIGANAVILPGVTLGDGCIVGAGAVVTKSFAPGTILVGVPARPRDP